MCGGGRNGNAALDVAEGAGEGPLDGNVDGVAAPLCPSVAEEGAHEPLAEADRFGLIEGTGEEEIDC